MTDARTDAVSRSRALQASAICLGYPDDSLLGRRPLLREVAAALPGPAAGHLTAFLDHLDAGDPTELRAQAGARWPACERGRRRDRHAGDVR